MKSGPQTLPHNLVRDILLHLPLKSLLRFKFACKSWRSLISDPQFGLDHLNLNSSKSNILRYGFIAQTSDLSCNSLSFYTYDVESGSAPVESEYPFKGSYLNAQILGSCNGLLLIGNCSNNLFLWNPSTKEYKKILSPFFADHAYALWALGYDSSTDDYKVVQIVTLLSEINCTCAISFSFKRNSWRGVEFCNKAFNNRVGILVNESPHWIVDKEVLNVYTNEPIRAISCFDMKTEEFREVPSPSWGIEGTNVELGTLGDCLCIATKWEDCVMVSVMKEYGMKESWTDLFVAPYSHSELRSLGCVNNGNVIMQMERKKFRVYDNLERRFIRGMSCDNSCGFKVGMYVESLVSPIFLSNSGVDANENGGMVKSKEKEKKKGKRKGKGKVSKLMW
ncbi:hypothetical protein LguiA_031095 [Lonicera macranthoides]